MKKITLFILCLLASPVFSQTNLEINQINDSLKNYLFDFLISTDDFMGYSKAEDPLLIVNDPVTYKNYKNQEFGIFKFCLFAPHADTHILLVSKGKYTIVNLHEPLEKTLITVIEYLKKNKNFSKEDPIKYIEALLDLYNANTIGDVYIEFDKKK